MPAPADLHQLVTTTDGRGIYTLQINTHRNLSDGNPFIVQSEQVGDEVEPISVRRLDTYCKIARYSHGASRGHYGNRAPLHGHFQEAARTRPGTAPHQKVGWGR